MSTAADPLASTPPAAPDTAADTQRQIDELKEQVAEAQRTAQYWADKAKPAPAPAPAPVVEEEPDVLEALTTNGAKGFDALASKRGFIRRDEVEQLINTRAQSLTTEQNLLAEYPDLKNKGSDFFKATAAHYGDLVKAGTPQAVAMGLAAKQAELQFIRDGKIKLPGQAPALTREEKETARLARVAAQGGDTGRRSSAPAEDDDGELDANQLNLVRKMLVGTPGADGKPMTEAQAIERYKVRAKAGVAMRGGAR